MSLAILRVIPFHEPARRFGGVVTQAALTSRELVRRGHRLSVLTTDLDVDPRVPRNVPVARDGYEVMYACTRRPWHREPPYAPPLRRRAFDAAVAASDVVLLNVGLTLWNRAAAHAARRARVPYVYNAEGCLCPTRLAVKRLRKRVFVHRVERAILRHAARLIAVTRDERENYIALGADPSRIAVVPNGVVIRPPQDPAARAGGRRDLGVPEGTPLVLFLGRLDPLKGIDLLLTAARLVAHEGLTFHVAIVGPDEGYRGEVERLAAAVPAPASARVHGAMDGAARDRALAAADVFALTSRSEGLPNAVLEAAAAGLPCLVTRACHVPEIAESDAGEVVDGNAAAIAGALRELVGDNALRGRQGANARRLAAEAFAIETTVGKLEQVLRAAIAP